MTGGRVTSRVCRQAGTNSLDSAGQACWLKLVQVGSTIQNSVRERGC